MAVAKQDANWVNIDVDTLPNEIKQAHASYKRAYAMMKEARTFFEEQMAKDIPQGQRMIFGYNFGKLSVAVVEDDRKVAKPKAQTQSLSEFLAQAKSHGDRT